MVQLPDDLEPLSEEEFAEFVARSRWQFAKTMPQVPHEYTVLNWSGDQERYHRAALRVWRLGRPGRWRRTPPKPYLEFDGHRYWLMTPPGVSTVMNRCALPPHPNNVVTWEGDELPEGLTP